MIQPVSPSPVSLSRSKPLMRMCGHPPIQDLEVSYSLVFEQIRITDENVWTSVHPGPGSELLSSVWADQNHWQELVKTHPGSESISTVQADQNYWQEWVNLYSVCESLSSLSVWEKPLKNMGDTSRKWGTLQCFSGSELLMEEGGHASSKWVFSSFSVDLIH